MIELNLIKPKPKLGINSILNLLDKWRFDLKKKLVMLNYYKLFWMSLDIAKCLKIKKI